MELKSIPLLETSLYINLTHSSPKKSDIDLNDQSCENVTVTVTSNGTIIFEGFNHGYCYVPINADTNKLVPETDFIINATYENGASFLYT